MRRRLTLLALPLVLAAFAFGVKWRADHPTLTKEDLEMRASMRQSSLVEVTSSKNYKETHIKLSRKEFEPFVDNFYLSPEPKRKGLPRVGRIGIYKFDCFFSQPTIGDLEIITTNILVDSREGNLIVCRKNNQFIEYTLHPITVKRWTELLLASPRIGPELRARMK